MFIAQELAVPQRQGRPLRRKTVLFEKAAYSRAAEIRLAEAAARMAQVEATIRSELLAGHIELTRPLQEAQRAVDANLEAVRSRLEQLRQSGDEEWKEHARGVDTAWEHLSQSIKRLVIGYSDGKH